ncbi:MAG: hypothetical protein IH945_00775 [Armatimonadetes bacterium]|nr:hypothetical protein [Armatimonadota bacterium]
MKNVTISMDEGLLKAAKEYAAKQGISFQALVRKIVRQTVEPDPVQKLQEVWDYADSLNIKSDGKYLTREEIYDRESIRRHEPLSVRDRPAGKDKEEKGPAGC